MKRVDAYVVSVDFVEHWFFKYGPPRSVLSNNDKQFSSKLFQGVCHLQGTPNAFTPTYHAQTNDQAEKYNRSILAILWCYVNDHQIDWDKIHVFPDVRVQLLHS